MDFVNKAYAQLADVFKTLTPGSRIAVGLLLAAVVLALLYLVQFPMTGGDEYLLGGRPFYGDELTRAEAAFAKAGLNGSQIADGNRIRIPLGQKERYLAALAESSALPADFYKYLDEAAASDNPFSSTRSLEMRRWNAKQKELALIISRMRGITSATVQYDETANRGSLRGQTQKTAMVAVQTTSGELDEDQIKAIRNIIVGSYAGLDRNHISINDITSGRTYTGADEALTAQENLYSAYKKEFERDWKQKIQDQLSWIPGVIVNVNVELSSETEGTTRQATPDPKTEAVSSVENRNDSKTIMRESCRTAADATDVNGNRSLALTPAAAPETQESGVRSQESGVRGQESAARGQGSATPTTHHSPLTTHDSPPLVPTLVAVAIQFPSSYVVKTWRQSHSTAAGSSLNEPDRVELERIRGDIQTKVEQIVRSLLPSAPQAVDLFPRVTVTAYDDLQGEALPAPSLAFQARHWLADNWRSLAMVGVGALCLLVLWSMVRRAPGGYPACRVPGRAAAPSALVADTAQIPRPHADETGAGRERGLRRSLGTSEPNLKQELQELVEEDPDAAAAILRNWIGDAA